MKNARSCQSESTLPTPTPTLTVLLAGALMLALAASPGFAFSTDNWPSFRGPGALSVADDDPRLPMTWSTTDNVAWKAPVPGLGWSSPVIWGDKVFVTTVVSDGEIEEPRMGLYFPYGSPESGGMPTKEGVLIRAQTGEQALILL